MPARPERKRDDTSTASSQASSPLCLRAFASRPSQRADDRRARGTGYKREAGMPSSALPAPLREIGFDQNLDQRVPLDIAVPRRARPRPCGSATTSAAAGRAGVRVLRLPDAVHAGDQRPVERARRAVARTRARTSRSSPSASTRATRRRRPRRRRRVYLERYKRPGAADGWHFLTGDQPSIERLTQAAGFRYAWDETTQAVRAPDRHHRADAGRPARAVPLRHRVRPARSAARRSSRRRRARSARPSTRCCSTAITTTR